MCSIFAVTLIIVFSNNWCKMSAKLLYNSVNRHRRSVAADSQKNGEQWQSGVLLSRNQLLLANERQDE
jgi:hypothetical protein